MKVICKTIMDVKAHSHHAWMMCGRPPQRRLDGYSPEVHSHLKFGNSVSDTCPFKKKLYLTWNCFHFIGGKMRPSPKRPVSHFWDDSQEAVRHHMVVCKEISWSSLFPSTRVQKLDQNCRFIGWCEGAMRSPVTKCNMRPSYRTATMTW
jgi:hypothetical protein